MHKSIPFHYSLGRDGDASPSRLPPSTRSTSAARLHGQTDAERSETVESGSSFSTRGSSPGKVLSSSIASERSFLGRRRRGGRGEVKADVPQRDAFSLFPPSRNVPHIVMDPLAVLRQCIRYFACHPELYGTNLRSLLDREIMHVMRLQASESSIAIQQPVVSSDDVRTALEIMRQRNTSSSSLGAPHEGCSATSASAPSRLPAIHPLPPKSGGGGLLSCRGEDVSIPGGTPPHARFPSPSPRQERGGRNTDQLLGYGALLFMPIRYDFEALTKKYAEHHVYTEGGDGSGGERMLRVPSYSSPGTLSTAVHTGGRSSSYQGGEGYSSPSAASEASPRGQRASSPLEKGVHGGHVPSSAARPGSGGERQPHTGETQWREGGEGTGVVLGGVTPRTVDAPSQIASEEGPLMLTLSGEGERLGVGDSVGKPNDGDSPISTFRQASVYPVRGAPTMHSFSPPSTTNSLWPMENVFMESLKQLMEQQFHHRSMNLDHLPFVTSSPAGAREGGGAFGTAPSVVLIDANGYEVSYLRHQLQQMEAAYNAKCIRLHELVEENSRLEKQLHMTEEKGERWLSQYRECHAQVDAMRRELEGWREKAAEYENSADESIIRIGRKGLRKGIGLGNSITNSTTKKKSSTLSSHEGREAEVDRITKLWRETEKSLQETRRTLENSEKEANSTHDHLTDAFHYIERLERRLARRNRFIVTSSRRLQSLEEKYEKLMWCFREQSTIIGSHSYVDHAMADDPYWSLFIFYHLQQHVGDTYPMEETLVLGTNVLQPPPASAGKPLTSGGGGGRGAAAEKGRLQESGRNNSRGGSLAGLASASVPNLQFGRSHGGGRLIDERYDTGIIYHLMADEATGLTERRGRLKLLRTNLVGAVGCKVLRWENLFVIDYLGGEDSRPNASALNRMRFPLLTLASLTQPLRDANGIRMDAIYPPPEAKKPTEQPERKNGRRRSVNDAPSYTLPEDPGPLNTYLYDQATVRLLLRNFWRERADQFSRLYYQRVLASKDKASRAMDFPTLAPWGDDMMMMMMMGGGASVEEEEGKGKEKEEAENYPNTFLAGLMVYVFRLCGAKKGPSPGLDASNDQGRGVSTGDKRNAFTAGNGAGTAKSDTNRSLSNSEQKGRRASSTAEKDEVTSMLLAVRGMVSKDPGLWDDGRIFFACVANAKIRGNLPGKEACAPPNIPEFTPAMREMICAMYYYTMEYKEIDPDFRLFYLVSHQLIPEVVGINFYASIEAIQLDCETLIQENLNPYAEGKALEKIKKDAFPHTVSGLDGNFYLLGKNEFLVSSSSSTGNVDDQTSSVRSVDDVTSGQEGGGGDTSGASSATLLLSHLTPSHPSNVGNSNVHSAVSPLPSKASKLHPSQAFQYSLLSPVEAIARAAELIDRAPVVAEEVCLEEDSDEDGYGTVLPGVVDKPGEGTVMRQSVWNQSGASPQVGEGGRLATGNGGILCRDGSGGVIPVIVTIGGGSGEPQGAHSPSGAGKQTVAGELPPSVSLTAEGAQEEGEASQRHSSGGGKKKRSSISILETSQNALDGTTNAGKSSTNMLSTATMTMVNNSGEEEMTKLRHDLLEFLETLRHRRSSKQKEEYEKRKERILAEQQQHLAFGEDPREAWQQLDGEIRRIFGPHSEIVKDFMSLETSDGVGGQQNGGKSSGVGSSGVPGSATGKHPETGSSAPASHPSRCASSTLFLRNRRQRMTFDDRVRRTLAATRGLIPLEDFVLLFHKHCFATYALAACGSPRFPVPCRAPSEEEDFLGESYYEPYHRVGFMPPLPIHLQRLRMALALDQPTSLINYRQLFSTDVQTFSPTHFYAEFLTLTLDVFAQQQNFFMQVVLSSCNARHARYFHEGAEECNGIIPVSNLKSGFTKSLEMIDATPAQVAALVEHLQGYDALLREEEVMRVEQFTDLPFLFTSHVGAGEAQGGEEESVNMEVLQAAGFGQSGVTDGSQPGDSQRGDVNEMWHFEDETADCSLLHLSLAIRMLYPVWGMSCLKQAKRLSELLLTWTPITKIDPHASLVPPIIQVNAPCTPFESDIQRRYLISAQHLAQGNSGYCNPLRVTAKWVLEEARLKAEGHANEMLSGRKVPGRRKSGPPANGGGPYYGNEKNMDTAEELPNYNFEIPVEKQLEGGGMIPNWRLLRQSFAHARLTAIAFPSKDMPLLRERRNSRSRSAGRRSSSTTSTNSRQRKDATRQGSEEKPSVKIVRIEVDRKDEAAGVNSPSRKSAPEALSQRASGGRRNRPEGGGGGAQERMMTASSFGEGRLNGSFLSEPPPIRDFGLYILSRAMGMSRSYTIQGPPSNKKKKKKGSAKKKSPTGLPFGVELQLQLQGLHFGNTVDMLRSSRSLLFQLLAPLKDGATALVHDYPSDALSYVPHPRTQFPNFSPSPADRLGSERHGNIQEEWKQPSGKNSRDAGSPISGYSLKRSGKVSPLESLQSPFLPSGRSRAPGSPSLSTLSFPCPSWVPAFRNAPPKRRRSTVMLFGKNSTDMRDVHSPSGAMMNGSGRETENKILLYVEDLRCAMAALSLIS